MNQQDRNTKAAERYKILVPLLDPALDKSEQAQLRRAIAAQVGVNERTLRRWENSYIKDGFDALKPAVRVSSEDRVITEEVLKAAIKLRREVPKRSVNTIIRILEMEEIVPVGSIKRSTLQEALMKAGFSSRQMSVYAPDPEMHYGRRFQKAHRNDMWQCDIKYGPALHGKRTYLFTVIDDATRYICHSEFFMHQDLDSLMKTLRAAFENAGLPDKIYLDNGKVFRSKQMDHIAAKLGIGMTFIKPYRPMGHGKIERFNNTVDGFINEIILEHPDTLQAMNDLYAAWLEECYQRQEHSMLNGKTPLEAYEQDTKEIRFVSSEELHNAFLMIETRKVNRTGCISLNNEQWEIEDGSLMIGRRVNVLIDPAVADEVTIECEGFPPCRATKLVIREHTGARPKPKDPLPQAQSSRLLQGVKKRTEERREKERRDILRFASANDDNDNGEAADVQTILRDE